MTELPCPRCSRTFKGPAGLDSHLRARPSHKSPRVVPAPGGRGKQMLSELLARLEARKQLDRPAPTTEEAHNA